MATRATALKSFDGKPGEGAAGGTRVRRGDTFVIESENRAKILARKGLVSLIGEAAADMGKSQSTDQTAQTGAKDSSQSSAADQAQQGQTSTASETKEEGEASPLSGGSVTINEIGKKTRTKTKS